MTQEPPPVTSDPSQAPAVPVCYRHPRRETYIRCVRCERPICPDCMNEASVGFQCPECVAAGRRTQRSAKTMFGGSSVGQHGYVTKALVVINVAVMIVGIVWARGGGAFGGGWGGLLGGSTQLSQAGSVYGLDYYRVGGQLVGVAAGVANGEFYRLLTSMFIHYGLLHLLLNMWALWIIGRQLEAMLGPGRFLLLYLLSGVGGSVVSYIFTPGAAGAGASGAIYGLFAVLFLVARRLRRDTSSIISVLVINLIFSFTVPGISIAAHLGGLAFGAIVGVALAYPPQRVRNRVLALTSVGLVLFMTAAVVAQTAALQANYPPLPGM